MKEQKEIQSQIHPAMNQLTEAGYPQCLRCGKPVERLTLTPSSTDPNLVTVEYHCHGESVEQEVSAAMLAGENGLASYTAFNDFTSGLLPHKQE